MCIPHAEAVLDLVLVQELGYRGQHKRRDAGTATVLTREQVLDGEAFGRFLSSKTSFK